MASQAQETRRDLHSVGLFAGIGGIELGLTQAGFHPSLFVESDPGAQAVLRRHFPQVPLVGEIQQLFGLGRTGVVCAGFPCQDLSQAGRTAGIGGSKSSLVNELFRLLDASCNPEWVLIENVPFMLHLGRGAAIRHIVEELEKRKFRWAYRVIDARAFGIPQRRRRVLFLASRHNDPRPVLLNEEAEKPTDEVECDAYGFYWTEGNTGLGWARNALPTLKGGSSLGIPSPPAIWIRDKGLFTPDIRDAERLQGFASDWTQIPDGPLKLGHRWKLVGNAVCVAVAAWLGKRLNRSEQYSCNHDSQFDGTRSWPTAAWGERGRWFEVTRSAWPVKMPYEGLLSFLQYPVIPLSTNAASGFLSRAVASSLRFERGFLTAVRRHSSSRSN
jgi:DNA (cytosine-5)-methyltransferase 1